MKFIGIIPARFASTRFPGKPLVDICGMPMIERVYRRASAVLPHVYVATDDSRIAEAVAKFGGTAIMTSELHRSGTDRCFEAYTLSGSDADVIINIQGDEPFVAQEQIKQLMSCFDDDSTDIATLVRRFNPASGYEALENPNTPKVVLDKNMNALYFSRSVIPYVRGKQHSSWPEATNYYTHVGMYAYRANVLKRIVAMPQSQLELAESLEQLRWLQNGCKIKVAVTDSPTIGIDTPDDLKAAIDFCKRNNL
ncbi:MAG: 3-deoxy-manno-octulosonate cytidylyltransferase [Muribaculum sp.]|nr:3-deoxy-manno-octulosonate cytidylyltransferase [Muribaculaceae bacterium]MCM1080419.1 3-deoxy-manno-octulosonate cytidylyltransferase [Muribaculum sp.]